MNINAQITRRAAADRVNATTVERDYVLAQIIAAVATLGAKSGLVFKGGTALRLCHFEDYRYSADLDFSLVDCTIDEAYASILAALDQVSGEVSGLRLTALSRRGPTSTPV